MQSVQQSAQISWENDGGKGKLIFLDFITKNQNFAGNLDFSQEI